MYLAKERKRKKRRKVSGRRRRKNVPRSVLYGMTFLAFLACSTLIFFAYHSQEAANPASADTSQSSQDTTTISFIQTIGESVRQIAAQNDLYASVMIAQAILESNSGQSKLSQAPNYNFFGIKGDYKSSNTTDSPTYDPNKTVQGVEVTSEMIAETRKQLIAAGLPADQWAPSDIKKIITEASQQNMSVVDYAKANFHN